MGAIAGTLCMHSCVEPSIGRFRTVDVPWHPEELTAEVLTDILRKEVIPETVCVDNVQQQIFGVGEGLMSGMYRLEISYGDDESGLIEDTTDKPWPKTLVAKLTPPTVKPRLIGEFLNVFKAEAEYYSRKMPQLTGMLAPHVYLAAHGGYGRYIVLMEDLAPRKCGNQVAGISAEEATDAVRSLARFHSNYRNRVASAEETQDWVQRLDDEAYYKMLGDAYCSAVLTLTDERFEFFGVDPDSVPHLKAYMHYVNDNYGAVYLPILVNDSKAKNPSSQFSSTLVHGDFRAENIFFPEKIGGEPMVVDYATVREGFGGEDLLYFLLSSMTAETKQKSEGQLLQLYLEESRRCGATDLTMEELLLTYQAAHLLPLIIWVIAQKDTPAGESEKGMLLMKNSFERLNTAVRDWNVLEVVKLRHSKLDSNFITSKYTREEVLLSIPQQYHSLLS